MLKSANISLTAEAKSLDAFNAQIVKDNERLTKENDQVAKDIALLIQRIDVSTLLKQIDLEEMKVLANNNNTMSMAFQGLLHQWEGILKNIDNQIEK